MNPPLQSIDRVPELPARPADGHKGTFGTVLLIAGSPGMLGAAILAARGALRGGVGLCRVALPGELTAFFTVAVPAATTVDRGQDLPTWMTGADAVVVGPGLGSGPDREKMVRAVLAAAAGPVVLDADGLNALSPLTAPLPSSVPIVCTPHPREAGRLLGSSAQAVQEDRDRAVAALCEATGQICVLKGAGTLVSDGRRVFHNRTGNAGMATGGTGDVLAGLIGALLAQGMDPFDAACLGVHVHGRAGDLVAARLSERGLCAEDLPWAIAEVMK